MAALPYMQFEVAKYLADTTHLTTLEHGAYLLLLFNYWQRGKPPADNDARLASVVHLSNTCWIDVRTALEEFFEIKDGYWFHDRIEDDLLKAKTFIEKKKKAGLASAMAKNNTCSNTCSTPVQHTFNKDKIIQDKIKKNNTKKKTVFIPPSVEEVKKYITEKGYSVNAKEFVEYYSSNDWKDSEGKPVLSWKQKMIAVWANRNNGNKPDESNLCVVDRMPGFKCMSRNGKKVYLCQECYTAMQGKKWGQLSNSEIERLVELGKKAKPSERSAQVDPMAEVYS